MASCPKCGHYPMRKPKGSPVRRCPHCGPMPISMTPISQPDPLDQFSAKKIVATIWRPEHLIVRKSDGRFFEASHKGFPDYTHMLTGKGSPFYFREIERRPRKWWHLRERWKRTGLVWEPQSGEFDVLAKRGS